MTNIALHQKFSKDTYCPHNTAYKGQIFKTENCISNFYLMEFNFIHNFKCFVQFLLNDTSLKQVGQKNFLRLLSRFKVFMWVGRGATEKTQTFHTGRGNFIKIMW